MTDAPVDLNPDIHLGLRQRHAASLVQDFYPDGMPDDWRGSYLVMMTQAIWVDDSDDDLVEILQEIVDAPKPVLTVWCTDDPAQANLWQAAHPDLPLIVLSTASSVWTPETAVASSWVDGARVALMPACDQPAQLRGWVESFVRQAPAGPCAVFVDGESPSVPTLDRLRTLIEMMGL